jgi:hypothetical protein
VWNDLVATKSPSEKIITKFKKYIEWPQRHFLQSNVEQSSGHQVILHNLTWNNLVDTKFPSEKKKQFNGQGCP